MDRQEHEQGQGGIDRRTVLRGVAASGIVLAGIPGISGAAAARGGPPGNRGRGGSPGNRGGGICHKGFECAGDASVKLEFVIEEDDDGNVVDCYFEEETDTGLVEVTSWEGKDGTACEPIAVEWESDGYAVSEVMAFGGTDCHTATEPEGSYSSGLENNGGQQAAISNLQFCLTEAEGPLPQCPFYGTSRSDPTEIVSIRYDAGAGTIVEQSVGSIPDDSANSNYPNGIAFDDDTDVWYFAEENGELKTMNEDGTLGIEEYGVVTPGGESIAGAAFWNDTSEYLYIPNGGSILMAAAIGGGTVSTRTVTGLDWSGIGLGDLAIDRDSDVLYVSTVRTNESGPNFFSVDLNALTDQQEIVTSNDRTAFAVRSQIAFDDDGTLWAHNANGGDWRTVNLSDGSLSSVMATTREYTDLAQCGFYDE